jgi:hypothetical protein
MDMRKILSYLLFLTALSILPEGGLIAPSPGKVKKI